MAEASDLGIISTKRAKIAKLASQMPQQALNTLAHHVDLEWLREAYRRTRKDGAPGVDGVTYQEYEAELEANLSGLLERFKSGTYRAPAVRRVHIPKDGGATRPIGIPTLEDKVLQRAVLMVLEPIYEHDFLECSYGFRPGRGAHDALEALWTGLMEIGGGWVLDMDIRSYFDSVDRGLMGQVLDRRVRDGVIRRAIGKWLHAGVMEEGRLWYPERGTPQGGVVSPLLANVYLHEVLDAWFEDQVKPRLRGRAFMVRYADDAVLCFEREEDARRVLAVLPKRLGRYGLELHADKTRLVDFRHPRRGGSGKGRCFEFLAFTHYWGRSRTGRMVVKRKTAKGRFGRALQRIAWWCRTHRHRPLREQQQRLARMLRGHDAYYGITGNARALVRFHHEVERIWRKWLDRRSWRSRMTWPRFRRLLRHYPLPPPRAVHSVYRRRVA